MPRSGTKFASVDSALSGLDLDTSKPGGLSMSEKHELVYELAKWPEGAPEILQSWTRKDILQILSAELGKERKYTGLPKCKIIEHLLRIVSLKESMQQETKPISLLHSTPANTQSISRRQRKREHPLRLPAVTPPSSSPDEKSLDNSFVCKNLVCRAILGSDDIFCKRCSCCICHRFDDNKDPSLWLVCSSEPPNERDSCGLSCHLECALKHERAGFIKDGRFMKLDGSCYCVSCGKVNELIGCWRKQLIIAKDARRVDVLCYRISLSHRLLNGTDRYKELHEIVDRAARKLEEEVGPVNGVSAKMARGIVNRLSAGFEVQKLCVMALEKAEALLSRISQSGTNPQLGEDLISVAPRVYFEDVSSTSVVVVLKEVDLKSSENVIGYKLWHRKTGEKSYRGEPTCVKLRTERRTLISNLQPSTEYAFKIVSFTSKGDIGDCECRCFTKSVEENQGNLESTAITGIPRTCGNLGSKNFSSISAENELLPKDGISNFKVRDLGKILRAAWAQEHESNGTCASPNKNLSIGQFPYCEKPETCNPTKPSSSSGCDINVMRTPLLEASGDENTCCNLIQEREPEDAHGDSVSALDEERGIGEMGLVQTSHVQAESQRDSTNSSDNNQVTELPKSDHENHSKVTMLEEASNDNEFNMPIRNEMEVVPFDCSGPILPVSMCKLDDTGAEILGNAHTKPDGDFENWAVKPIKEVPAVQPQTGVSRKRTFSRYDDLHDCDRTLQNRVQVSSLDLSGSLEKNYEYCVKMIRWLERGGHIQKEFRVKFLTWFSLRATPQEQRVVSVFIDTLLDDPASLAGQLVDTFSESVCSKRAQVLRNGFCSKLWH